MLHKSVNNINALSFLMLLRKDYEPHFFRFCTKEEAHNQWTRSPMQMEVRNVNSKNFVLTLKVWEEFVGNANSYAISQLSSIFASSFLLRT